MKRTDRGLDFKELAKDWAIYTFATFFLCDILWEVIDYGSWDGSWLEGADNLLVDLAYCGVFSLSSIATSAALFKLRYFSKVTYGRLLGCGIITLAANLLIAVACENVYDAIWPTDSDTFWGSVYFFCFISSLASFAHASQHYSMMIVRQNEENLTLQRQLLKRQLDPHFVFNSLSVLAGLTRIDPERAEAFTIKLSRLYRAVLNAVSNDFVSLEEALGFAHDYVDLLNVRFADKIELDTSGCRVAVGERIMSLAMQTLVENAAKHGRGDDGSTLRISIVKDGGRIRVTNNKPASRGGRAEASAGVGLENLRKRCMIEYGVEPAVRETDTTFEVEIPISTAKD